MGNAFLDNIPIVQYTLAITDEWDCMTFKGFYTAKGQCLQNGRKLLFT